MEKTSGGFARLTLLLQRGYRVLAVTPPEAIILEHPAGRRFPHWRIIAYDSGTIVGGGDYRIRSSDEAEFERFMKGIPKP